MAVLNVQTSDTFEQWRVKSNTLSTLVGDGDLLDTTASDLVTTVNDLHQLAGIRANLDTTATNLVEAVNEVRSGLLEGIINTLDGSFKIQLNGGGDIELQVNTSGDLTILRNINAQMVFANLTGEVTGNASTATKLKNTRAIFITGDATWETQFDGSSNATGTLTLANTLVTPGTYTKLTVDSKGRATLGTSLSNSDVTSALGYTPWHANNDGAGSGLDADLLDGFNSSTAAVGNTIVLRNASADITGNIFYGVATTARYADLAEIYSTDNQYPVGTVIVPASGGDKDATQSWETGQYAIGVISEKPAYLMNSEAEGQAVALRGRVPVRVVGPIVKSQCIMAGPDGRAVFGLTNPIGCALETNLDSGEKLVECVIR
jgi:hypothetical protein